jgi:hypothetical protein
MLAQPRRLARTVLLLLVAVTVVAGCGGDDGRASYEDGLAKVQQQLTAANEASSASADASDASDRSAALDDAQQQLEAAAETAAELDPPSDAADAHEDLVEALRDYAKIFGRIAALEPGDPSETELYGEAGVIVDRLTKANRALEEAGYRTAPDEES